MTGFFGVLNFPQTSYNFVAKNLRVSVSPF